MMDQIEIHPYCAQEDMLKYCEREGSFMRPFSHATNLMIGKVNGVALFPLPSSQNIQTVTRDYLVQR
eukprot:1613580-Amphidinium_carterae.1